MKSFQEYLDGSSEDSQALQRVLSLGYFGYEMYCKIVEEMHEEDHPRNSHRDDESEEGKKLSQSTVLLIELLKKLIAYYVSLIRTHTYSPREKQVRVHFLKDYIFHCMVEDLLVRGAAGDGCKDVVAMVREGELQDVRLTEIANLIKLSQITRLQIQSTREVIEEASFAQESDYFKKAVEFKLMQTVGCLYSDSCVVCSERQNDIFVLPSLPCPHIHHWECLQKKLAIDKHYSCPKCPQDIALSKKLTKTEQLILNRGQRVFPPEEGLKRPARYEKASQPIKSKDPEGVTYSEEDNKAFARLKDFEQVQVFEGLVGTFLP